MLKILGYSDQISVRPEERIRFFVHSEEPEFTASLVKIRSGDLNPEGPGLKLQEMSSPINQIYPGKKQPIYAGSYACVPIEEGQHAVFQNAGDSLTVDLHLFPTTPLKSQSILDFYQDNQGCVLRITPQGVLEMVFGNGKETIKIIMTRPLTSHLWYHVSFEFKMGEAILRQCSLDKYHQHLNETITHVASFKSLSFPKRALLFAGTYQIVKESVYATEIFNGKLDSISFRARDRIVAAWDFSQEIPTTKIIDTGPYKLHGALENLPTRGVTGYRYTGQETSWKQDPQAYSAIYFHDDDLYDAKWEESFQMCVPKDLKSGLYAVRLSLEDQEDFIPFVVRPSLSGKKNSLVVLFPSATYMAYANEHIMIDSSFGELLCQRALQIQLHQAFLHAHREYGNSLYDLHSDGSGVHYSSRLRPILNMRPKNLFAIGAGSSFLWQFNGDTHLLDWLEEQGIAYDMVTDEDLEKEGVSAIADHLVLMTTTHPEYYSTKMFQALEEYLHTGHRLMYMGGNGFYWRVAYHQELPGVIEIRRTAGTRAWETAPGEDCHSFNGELGGLWRYQNRSPNKLVGIGFAAQGFDHSSYYRCTSQAKDPRAAFIFKDVHEEILGNFGLIGNGAAGMEVDRYDPMLGSPHHALVLASSEKHTAAYMLAVEDIFNNYPGADGEQSPFVRADMTFFETPSDGTVFSTGSISWAGSLWHNHYQNNISQITWNVLKRFMDPKPFVFPVGEVDKPQDFFIVESQGFE